MDAKNWRIGHVGTVRDMAKNQFSIIWTLKSRKRKTLYSYCLYKYIRLLFDAKEQDIGSGELKSRIGMKKQPSNSSAA
jgi:hypothetical protein